MGRCCYNTETNYGIITDFYFDNFANTLVLFFSANMEAIVSDLVAPEDLKVKHFILYFSDCESKMT